MCDDHGAPRRPTQRLLGRVAYRLASPELERAVLDRAKPKGHDVESVVLVHAPWLLRPLLEQKMLGPLDIARGEGQRRFVRNRCVASARGADRVSSAIHMAEQPANIFGDQVGLERPGGVGIAK